MFGARCGLEVHIDSCSDLESLKHASGGQLVHWITCRQHLVSSDHRVFALKGLSLLVCFVERDWQEHVKSWGFQLGAQLEESVSS